MVNLWFIHHFLMVLTTLLDFEVFLSGVILQVTKKVYPIASQGSHG